MPKISVIVPFFNCQAHIGVCIESLFAQTYPRAQREIIFVDNNSTDGSAALVAQYPEIRLLTQTKQGAYAARNCGIRAARGEILAFTDPDCIVAPQWLEEIARGFEAEQTQILLGYRHFAAPSLILTLLETYEAQKAAFVFSHSNPELYYGYTNNMAVRREVLNQVGLFRERARGSDTIFVQRVVAARSCAAVHFRPQMEIFHLEVDSVKEYYKKRLIYGQSNQTIQQALPYRPLSNAERWRVFLYTLRMYDYSVMHSLVLLGLLIPGALYYELGRWHTIFPACLPKRTKLPGVPAKRQDNPAVSGEPAVPPQPSSRRR